MAKVNDFEEAKDEYIKGESHNFVQFTVESNLHYRYTSAEELLKHPDVLSAMILDHYNSQTPRLAVLDDYYKARNTNIVTNTRRKEPEKADHRASHNWGKILCTFDVGYSTGNAIKVTASEEDEQKTIDEFNDNNDVDGLNGELWLDMDKYGRAYEGIFRNEDDEDELYLCNVFETFMIYDTSIKRKPIMAIRYPKTRFTKGMSESYIQPIIYTEDETIYFKETILSDISLIELSRESHSFKEVPITEYSPNRFRMGIYEDVLSLIDLYDAAQSDTANYMTDLNDALLVISGDIEASGLSTEEAIAQKNANMLLLESGIDVNGNKTAVNASYIYKQYDVNGVEAYKNRIHDNIHEIAMIPDLTDQKFAGNQSGEAMKYKLFNFEQMTSNKQRNFKKGLTRRYRLLFNVKQNLSELTNSDIKGLQIRFTPNVPKAVLDELKALVDSGAEISQETMLGLASFIDDVPQELEKIKNSESQEPLIQFDSDKTSAEASKTEAE